ncbi:MAG: hypothetical protein JXR73_05140 [Candidatus Omnitrophica bacterium]|nr:hypothetical protein [Candidatus Omnitrophota bacterium]
MMKIRIPITIFLIAAAACIVGTSRSASAQHFTEDNAWAFLNFGTPVLTWDQYRDTFIGTPPDYSYETAALDAAFYDGAYKTLAAPGNCYGMSLMAQLIRQKGGHLGYCYPVSQYSGSTGPSDTALAYAINLMHGHQINLNSLKQYLELFATGKTRDGNYAFSSAEYYELSDDPTLVNITKTLNPLDGGHTMAVYDTYDLGSEKRIYVYDPNRSWYESAGNSWYTSGSNYISIETSTSKWSFDMAGSGTWSGDPSSGGNIIIQPLSIAGPRDRSPVSMGLDALSFLNQFFIYGSGNQVKQITNSKGKRLFKPGTNEIDNDPNTGLLNTVPIYPSDAGGNYNYSSFVMFGNPGGALEFDIESTGGGYQIDILGPRSILSIMAESEKGRDRFFVENPGMITPKLSLKNTISAQKYDVKFTQFVNPGEENRVFFLKDLVIPPENTLELKITPDQKGVEVFSPKVQLGYNLLMERWTTDEKQTVELPQLSLNPGENQIVKAIDWQNLRMIDPIIRIQPIVIQPIIIEPIIDPIINPIIDPILTEPVLKN